MFKLDCNYVIYKWRHLRYFFIFKIKTLKFSVVDLKLFGTKATNFSSHEFSNSSKKLSKIYGINQKMRLE